MNTTIEHFQKIADLICAVLKIESLKVVLTNDPKIIARAVRKTGRIVINANHRFFESHAMTFLVLAHEVAHHFLRTNDEMAVDELSGALFRVFGLRFEEIFEYVYSLPDDLRHEAGIFRIQDVARGWDYSDVILSKPRPWPNWVMPLISIGALAWLASSKKSKR